jgi:hypothetical protein
VDAGLFLGEAAFMLVAACGRCTQGSQYHYDHQNRSSPVSMKFMNVGNIGRNFVQIQISEFGEIFENQMKS